MPCHPDRVRRNYEAGRAAAASASWQRPFDIAAEQLQRRSAPVQWPVPSAALAAGVTANVIEGEEHDGPDEDCLWAV